LVHLSLVALAIFLFLAISGVIFHIRSTAAETRGREQLARDFPILYEGIYSHMDNPTRGER
jgi:hypothetical protein